MNEIKPNDVLISLRGVSERVELILDGLSEEYSEDEITFLDNVEVYGGLYEVFNLLAIHISKLDIQSDYEELVVLFNLIEQWHTNGNQYVAEAATVGLLEDLTNSNITGSYKIDDVLPIMGKTTQYWLAEVREFWSSGKIIGADKNA